MLQLAADAAKARRAAAALQQIAAIGRTAEQAAGLVTRAPRIPPIPVQTLRGLSRALASQWEKNVFRYLQISNKGNVGEQITLRVFNRTRNVTETIRIDDLVRNPGAAYTLNDAKFTAPVSKYLTTADLKNTLTKSQLTVADWMRNGHQLVFMPTGSKALEFGLSLNQPIEVEPVFHIYVQTPDGVPMLRKYP